MENPKFIIAINREFGSGGREIACKLGELLGINVYDKAILDTLTSQFNLTVEEMEKIKAQKTNWWSEFCRFYQQFGAVGQVGHMQLEDHQVTSQQIYLAEAHILRGLAEQESCVIIGRSGFHVFKDNPYAMKIFLIADRNARVKRVMEQFALDEDAANKRIDEVDKARDNYTLTFAGVSRYDARNYDFVFNITQFPTDLVAQFLADNIRKKYPFLMKQF
ncbi:MAG: cytidylate kinase-like family protein [Bacteroidales bacterium]|nr:cytidylate kinase-like family protein [Bacteroidales bacterium]